ncbi:phosphoadenosine phosphosulfate reductase domain-containing protein [Dictyobacter aurantiacus]|uniref:Phosphoadenosine phosphosulphate reductase domain-containing protein n=1 Tax=Dictyobacter aurantiacus TaxID=1936993 RepID=A0A401ZH12_9CHLR|nr:phosphoadenosine phosphosulfate reductase family protein [Dictyobacter aurantiacus]GCE06126.1 hypothetical protein KDAU_34550 [Dictyobacter aurantiacus]
MDVKQQHTALQRMAQDKAQCGMGTSYQEVPAIEAPPLVAELIQNHAPVAFGVSGGKDSSAMALATTAYLDQMGHQGPRILIHSDLGRVEWAESLPMCQRLADRLGIELIVVRRQAGDLLDRWCTRWHNNVARYAQLSCVKLILPWSTASMRFCTSELKTAIICRELVQRFPGQTILSVAGLRADESPLRAKLPVLMPQARLTSKTLQTTGYNWHPLLPWSLQDVLCCHQLARFPLHEAYTTYGSSRVSCAFCMLGSRADLIASSACPDNQAIYRAMVELEITSTFSFQEQQWLGDVAPHLLPQEIREQLHEAKGRARQRERIEARIPRHLLYSKGWPLGMPTYAEAILLSEVRREIAALLQLSIGYTEPDAILERYHELLLARPLAQQQRPEQRAPIQHCLWDEHDGERMYAV